MSLQSSLINPAPHSKLTQGLFTDSGLSIAITTRGSRNSLTIRSSHDSPAYVACLSEDRKVPTLP